MADAEVPDVSHDDNRAKLDQMVAAMLSGDIDGLTGLLADDAVVEWPQSGERIVGREACTVVYRNYPGGSPAYQVKRISGEGDHFTIESVADYAGEKVYVANIVEFRDGKVVRQTDYFANPFEAPAWRSQWVERMESV
jgi:ketosteroid isomerase-like protein